jgi:hypothetical protein
VDLDALDLGDDAMGRVQLAQWCAFLMELASRGLADIGAKTGLLDTLNNRALRAA